MRLICLLLLCISIHAANGPNLTVDAAADDAPISRDIYGMNFPDASLGAELRLSMVRNGGNSTTRYNYLNDASCKGSDWFFLAIGGGVDQADMPDGSSFNQFIESHTDYGATCLVTMPLIGWTPRTATKCWSYSVAKYGAQQITEVDWQNPYGAADAGNGVLLDGTLITANDPTDTCQAIDETWVSSWIAYLRSRYGTAAADGISHYSLDNEPMLWNSTHRDVHPEPNSYDELWQRSRDYAIAI